MKKFLILFLILGMLFLVTVSAVVALGPAPSWQLSSGVAGSCSGGNVFIPNVSINVPSAASERGTLSAPGFPNLGYTQDTNFTGVGNFGFTVFATAPFALPPNTLLTLSVQTYGGPNYTGEVAYISTMVWDCTTGAVVSLSNSVPEKNCPYPLPSGSTVRSVPLGAPVYYAADLNTRLSWNLPAGSWWVSQISGDFAKVWIACTGSPVWIPTSALG